MNDLETRLEVLQERRAQLVNLWLFFIVFTIGSLALPRMAVRFFGASAFFLALFVTVIVLTFAGLWLLVQTIYNLREQREIQQALRDEAKAKQSPRWRRLWHTAEDETPETHFVIGPDGELVEVEDEQDKQI
jgi:Na+(H+)/acetate symporter ActP